MNRIIVSASLGQLRNGRKLVLFPSRWTASVVSPSKPFCFYPYELAYLSTLLKREIPDADVKMLDPNMLGMGIRDAIEYISSYKPDALIMEPSAVDSDEVLELMEEVKSRFGTTTIVGGAYAQAEPLDCIKRVDYAIPGEYEFATAELLLALKKGLPADEIPGVYPNPRRNLINPDNLPFPEDEDICRLDYTEPGCDGRMIQVYASRGCPLACTFCVSPTYYGCKPATWRKRSPKSVVDEIEYLNKKYRGRFDGIFFNEESHNSDKAWVAELCNEIIARGLNDIKYDAMCIYQNFDDELMGLMRRAGYHQIRFGIESLDGAIGKSIHKMVKYDNLKTKLEMMKRHGFVTYGTSIVGGQDSSFESDLNTHNQLCMLRDDLKLLDKWQISIATPQPGTEFYSWAKRNGHIISDDLSDYNGRQAVCSYPDYSSEEINFMYGVFSRRSPLILEQAKALFNQIKMEKVG